MKINLILNNYFVNYKEQYQKPTFELNFDIIKKIPLDNNLIILRGEPTVYHAIHEVLDLLHKKNYILTTDGEKVENLFIWKGKIPYISFNYDGFINDTLRGNRNYLTKNILRALNYYAGKSTLRLAYTLNPLNKEWLDVDISILRHLYEKYVNMKKPYFMIHQQGIFFNQVDFSWTPIDINIINKMNKASILTDKSLRYFAAYHDQAKYSCIAPQNEITIDYEGIVRLCMSFKFDTILGDLNKQSFEEIIDSSEEIRNSAESCNKKQKCWLSLHCKENLNV